MKVYSIKEINQDIGAAINKIFDGNIIIKGELQPPKKYANGSQYCQLLEKSGKKQYQLSCVILGWENYTNIDLVEFSGQEVMVSGQIDFYDGTGRVQFKINEIEIFGEGALKRQIEILKSKLAQDGVFNNQRLIPQYPKYIGVITSEQGAVIHDIFAAVNRRFPLAKILLYPATVQGDSASKIIRNKIIEANDDKKAEVLIIARGGGSFFDLMPFNDETLIREIFKSNIPVVTGIGHEPDITLSDYAADKSMPTPTAAAEYVTPNKEDIVNDLNSSISFFEIEVSKLIDHLKTILTENNNKLIQYNPTEIIKKGVGERSKLEERMKNVIAFNMKNFQSEFRISKAKIVSSRNLIMNLIKNFSAQLKTSQKDMMMKNKLVFSRNESKLLNLTNLIKSLNPKLSLKRGFSILRDPKGKVLKSVNNLNNKKISSIELSDGTVKVKNIEIE